jgi:ADP-ribose pyrophosphatase
MTIDRPKSKITRPPQAELVFQGKLFKVWQWDQLLDNGSTARFESLSRPDTVLILPVVERKYVLFADERQYGMDRMIRTLGGRVENGESAEDAARRELLEESGYIAGELILWQSWQPVNKVDWAVYLFITHNPQLKGNQSLDPTEKIELTKIPISELLNHNMNLEINDYEFLFQLDHAKTNDIEFNRLKELLKF